MFDRNLHTAEIAALKEEAGCNVHPILHYITEPLALLDIDGGIQFANKALTELVDLQPDDLCGRRFDSLCNEESSGDSIFDRLLMGASLKDHRVRLVTATGGGLPASISAGSVFNAAGDLTAFVVTVRDLSGQTRLVDELKTAKGELAKRLQYFEEFKNGVFQLLRELDTTESKLAETCHRLQDAQKHITHTSRLTALGELSAALAHELNQPLTVIKGLSQHLLRDQEEGSASYEKFRLIADASLKMETVIKHLTIFSRDESLKQVPVDLNAVINEALLIAREMLTNRSIEIILELSPVPLIIGSSGRLEQIIINIASNAKDAMPNGGVFKITTGEIARNGERFARMSFQDTGGGIPQHALARIFDPFFTTKEAGKGTGLGLSISHGIAMEHRGDISVENDPPRGCTFHLALPAAAQEKARNPEP